MTASSRLGLVRGWRGDRWRGGPGTPSPARGARRGGTAPTRFDVVRDVIRVESVVYKMLDKSAGYIKSKQFSSSTGAETEAAMTDLKSQGAVGWVLEPQDTRIAT